MDFAGFDDAGVDPSIQHVQNCANQAQILFTLIEAAERVQQEEKKEAMIQKQPCRDLHKSNSEEDLDDDFDDDACDMDDDLVCDMRRQESCEQLLRKEMERIESSEHLFNGYFQDIDDDFGDDANSYGSMDILDIDSMSATTSIATGNIPVEEKEIIIEEEVDEDDDDDDDDDEELVQDDGASEKEIIIEEEEDDDQFDIGFTPGKHILYDTPPLAIRLSPNSSIGTCSEMSEDDASQDTRRSSLSSYTHSSAKSLALRERLRTIETDFYCPSISKTTREPARSVALLERLRQMEDDFYSGAHRMKQSGVEALSAVEAVAQHWFGQPQSKTDMRAITAVSVALPFAVALFAQ